MNTRSLHFRLVASYSALVVIVALGWAAFTYRSLEQRLHNEMVETLTRRATTILMHLNEERTLEELSEQIEAIYSPEASNRFIRITEPSGRAVYTSGLPQDNMFQPEEIHFQPVQHIAVTDTPLASGQRLITVTVPQQINGQTWWVEMGAPRDQIDSALQELLTSLLIGLPTVVLLAAASGYILVHRSLKPVEDIRATAAQITFGNLSKRLPVSASDDTLAQLSGTLNHMLARLENAYQQATRFSADASHELRTPLAIMRSELESLVQEPGIAEALRERLGSLLEETEHLSRITEQLMTIARLDAGEARAESVTVDLSELVRNTAEQMQLLAIEKQLSITIKADIRVNVRGDKTRLRQVIVNLLGNAIKYTPNGGSIELKVESKAHTACLTVRDSGIGIHAESLPYVFERFYRADKVRSREEKGTGLGLAIVRAIAHAHGGSVSIESTEGAGTTVTVELPQVEA